MVREVAAVVREVAVAESAMANSVMVAEAVAVAMTAPSAASSSCHLIVIIKLHNALLNEESASSNKQPLQYTLQQTALTRHIFAPIIVAGWFASVLVSAQVS